MATPAPLVLYHRNCLDGLTAAAICGKYLRQQGHDDIDFQSVQYGHPLPDISNRDCYLLDFGCEATTFRRLQTEATKLTWIDHHRTHATIAESTGFLGIFDENDCAAGLSWHYFFPQEEEPPWLAAVRAKDLWQWRSGDAGQQQRALVCGLEHLLGEHDPEAIWRLNLATAEKPARRCGEDNNATTAEPSPEPASFKTPTASLIPKQLSSDPFSPSTTSPTSPVNQPPPVAATAP